MDYFELADYIEFEVGVCCCTIIAIFAICSLSWEAYYVIVRSSMVAKKSENKEVPCRVSYQGRTLVVSSLPRNPPWQSDSALS